MSGIRGVTIVIAISMLAGAACVKEGVLTGEPGAGGTTGAGGQGAFDGGPTAIVFDARLGDVGPACTTAPCAPGAGTTLVGSSGSAHTCALRVDGSLYCWGSNDRDALGIGAAAAWSLPVALAGAGQAAMAVVGDGYTCLASASGDVRCWGHLWGAPGVTVDGGPDTSMPPSPWKPAGLGSVRSLSGGSHQTCAAITDGSVQCWGVTPAAVTVEGLHRVTNLAVGFRHACALDADGLVSCWGDNDQSQLGEPSAIAASAQPVNVVGGATAIAAGGYFTCALVEQGRVTCWGDNFRGQLGATAASQTSAAPVQVQGISGATAIAAGGYFACAIVNGDVWCWGAAVDGSTSFSAIPTAVTGVGGGVTSIATGNGHVCALVDTGAVVCWGMNLDGELGGGSAGGPAGPTIVVGWP